MLDGNLTFAAGSECEDVLHIIKDYGLVPQSEMPGLNYGTDKPVHGELDALTKSYVQTVNSNPNKTLSTAWAKGFQGIVDAYLGECPQTFTVNGKSYTPATYRDEGLPTALPPFRSRVPGRCSPPACTVPPALSAVDSIPGVRPVSAHPARDISGRG